MSTELIINASLPETRIAMMESGEIQELLIERASGKGIVGNIYKGRVTRVLPGMQAAFVDIGLEKAAFLYVDDVYTHSEIWEDEEEGPGDKNRDAFQDVNGGSSEAASGEAAPGETLTGETPVQTASADAPQITPVENQEAAQDFGDPQDEEDSDHDLDEE